ncbi:MAG: sigma-54 dependent transcriptional regulator [Mucispirillum sp.]|nr:sigma-54 dependent transcriptional regulator [Mucispirillum sp.]
MISILIIDDEAEWSSSFKRILIKHKIAERDNIFTALNRKEALSVLLNHPEINLIFIDWYLGAEIGEHVLQEILSVYPEKYIVMLTGSESVTNAVNSIKLGARDYIIKSTPIDELIGNIKRITEILDSNNNKYRREDEYKEFEEYITNDPKMYAIFNYIKTIIKSGEHILITGESGVGKGILAKIIASLLKPDGVYIPINIAGYDDQMFADALFGHVKGGFTGAINDLQGIIGKGENGVIFLDEIGDLSMSSQVKLLYLIQDRKYSPIGSNKFITTNAKFIFATNQDLLSKMKDKTFRQDLFFRLTTHAIHIPPLRERPNDIVLLAKYFASQAAINFGKEPPVLTDAFIEKIKTIPFPGNIRQLRSLMIDLVARYSCKIDDVHIPDNDFFYNISGSENSSTYLFDDENIPTIDEANNILIKKAMEKTGNNQVKAALMLGISQPTLSRKWKEINES